MHHVSQDVKISTVQIYLARASMLVFYNIKMSEKFQTLMRLYFSLQQFVAYSRNLSIFLAIFNIAI